MSTQQCPVCGSVEVDTSDDSQEIRVPFGPTVRVSQVVNVCKACGESGDFFGINDDRIKLALAESVKTSVPLMLEALVSRGLSMAYLERALDLPARTAARWKSGESSAAVVALLRAIATFPWILGVAESGFDPTVAKTAVVAEAAHLLREFATANKVQYSISVAQTSQSSANVVVALNTNDPTRKVQHVLDGPNVFTLNS